MNSFDPSNCADCPFKTPEYIRRASRSHCHPLWNTSVLNPWTGGHFVYGVDSHAVQYRKAVTAIAAQEKFAAENPDIMHLLPLTFHDCDDLRWGVGATLLDHAVGMYARSWKHNDYCLDHPSFNEYAAGLLVSPHSEDVIKRRWPDQIEPLAAIYPPKPLKDTGPGSIWRRHPSKQRR